MSETITLDPEEMGTDRVELNLDSLGLKISEAGADWGESQVAVQLARQQVGSTVTDRHLDPVEMTIPLQVKEDSGVSLAEAAHRLQQKIGIFQSNDPEPNWIRRDFDDGGEFAGSVAYEVHSAALHGLQGWFMAHNQHATDVTLKLLRSPLSYAVEEIEGALVAEEGGRTLQFEEEEMLGTGPGLIRVRVTNANASEHLRGLVVALESRDHPQDATKDTTAALAYQAVDLTLRGGAVEAERSGVKVVRHTGLSAGWLTILSSEIDGVGHMTHRGVRRPWMRIFDPGSEPGGVELQLQFRPLGATRWSETKRTVLTPLVDDYSEVDMGECRTERAALGDERWEWRLQARAPSGAGAIDIDEVYLCPTEQMEMVSAPETSAGADTQSVKSPGTLENDASAGGTAWTSVGNAASSDNAYATIATAGVEEKDSQYLLTKKYAFALPESATPLFAVVSVERKGAYEKGGYVRDLAARLVKGGLIQATDAASPVIWPSSDATAAYEFDLTGYTASDLNSKEFGFALRAAAVRVHPAAENSVASVDAITVTVYYTEAEDDNRVCFAERSIEFRSDGVQRQHLTDDVWGTLIPEGFHFYAPPSYMEGRALRGIIIPSQGDFATLPDSGDNSLSARVLYRPAYHFAREAAVPGLFPGSALLPSAMTYPAR